MTLNHSSQRRLVVPHGLCIFGTLIPPPISEAASASAISIASLMGTGACAILQ